MNTSLPVAILAGGLATRLRPVTEKIPKALIEIAGEPFIHHQLRLLKSKGLTQAVLCIGHLGEILEDYLGDGSKFGMEISYSYDGEKLLGTGGALKKALPLLGSDFYILYGDSYLPIDYQEVAKSYFDSGKKSLMTVYQNEGLLDSSNVYYQNDCIHLYNKELKDSRMKHIDYGLGVFSAEVFANIGTDTVIDLANIYGDLLNSDNLTGHEIFERFYEVGSNSGIAEFESILESNPYKFIKN